jgi:hypothetical protein
VSDLKVGDRVRVADDGLGYANKLGTVSAPYSFQQDYETSVYLDDFDGGFYIETKRLSLATGARVAARAEVTIVVSFDGGPEYELTVDETNALIRDLELAVA